jgi:hypothetical protein
MLVAEVSTQVTELRSARLHLREDDIICIRVKDNVDVEIADARETFNEVKRLAGDGKKPVLVFSGSGGTITNEVRNFSASAEAGEPTLAEAVIANSLAHKLVVNILIKFANIGRPMKLFINEAGAVAWLKVEREKYFNTLEQ